MVVGEVTQQTDKQTDVSHLVEQVGVLEAVRRLETHRLLKCASASACLRNEHVADHLALLAPNVLQLVSNNASVEKLNQPTLDVNLVQSSVAASTLPLLSAIILCIVALKLELVFSAYIKISRDLAGFTDHVRDDQDETRLDTLSHFS